MTIRAKGIRTRNARKNFQLSLECDSFRSLLRRKFKAATVKQIEYDPNRSAHIALLLYRDGEHRYIISPRGIKSGDAVMSGPGAPYSNGNAMPLRNIPVGTIVHCVELKPGKGAQLARSAGSSVQFIGKEGAYAQLRLRSGEMRKVLLDCRASVWHRPFRASSDYARNFRPGQ